MAPTKGMPPGRWRLVGTAKMGGNGWEHAIVEEMDTGNLYATTGADKLWQLNERKGNGKQPKDKVSPEK